ncbi:MAG: tryptophan--tRNA ligase [Patescibacteria group bacterium]|nr:tryptophan--tRNA ligase [Patescibacteria group bacterium]MDE1945919.1 tryptophan--tRNA ligase [Patescibacteria group bacterium]
MSKEPKKILLSGVKPTGRVHLGNYFGAMKQFVDLQDKHDCYIFIADYHAMTTVQNAAELRQGIIDVALDYLAIGLDPKKITLFKQSDLPQVTELCWMFNCITSVSYLMLGHSFREFLQADFKKQLSKNLSKVGNLDESFEDKTTRLFSGTNTGVLDYPILMAADILIQDADIVPVGKDQKQHIEYARDTAQKFNNKYGETFKLPEPFILSAVETVPGTDGRKMSKSYDNVIPLFATDDEIKKAVMKIPTDSKGVDESKNPDESILFSIHKLLLDEKGVKSLRAKYEKGGMGYKEAKELLIKDLTAFITPLREKREKLAKDMKNVLKILKDGGKRASARAEKKMQDVRQKVGISIY